MLRTSKKDEEHKNLLKKKAMKGELNYSNFLGDYGYFLENYLAFCISELLKQRDKPIIIADIGGGVGNSWMNLSMESVDRISVAGDMMAVCLPKPTTTTSKRNL